MCDCSYMVNIWEYANRLPSVLLTAKNGKTYSGNIVCVMDSEETDDTEDSLTLEEANGKILVFFHSEIAEIVEK